MSAELVPINNDIAEASDRRAALERLNIAAETADSPEEARAIMLQGKVSADVLAKIQGSYHDAWLAGKASVTAARRLGLMLSDVSSKARSAGRGHGNLPSPRAQMISELGISYAVGSSLVRLGRIPDPDFQRYIQKTNKIPSANGALYACWGAYASHQDLQNKSQTSNWRDRRKRAAGVKTPANPSLDEAYSLIVRALGHLSANNHAGGKRGPAVGAAIDHLYHAEDLLKPYRAGYGE